MQRILVLFCFALLLSCNENRQAEQPPVDATALSDTLEVETNRQVTLLPEAQEKVSNWLAYATAYNLVEDLRTASGRELVSNAQPMVQIMESLSTTLPDSLQQSAVRARTTVLLTKAHVLHQVATKKDIKPAEIFEAANAVINEFDNFKLQLNELFLKTPQDFELELDRQAEKNRDSLKQAREKDLPTLKISNNNAR